MKQLSFFFFTVLTCIYFTYHVFAANHPLNEFEYTFNADVDMSSFTGMWIFNSLDLGGEGNHFEDLVKITVETPFWNGIRFQDAKHTTTNLSNNTTIQYPNGESYYQGWRIIFAVLVFTQPEYEVTYEVVLPDFLIKK